MFTLLRDDGCLQAGDLAGIKGLSKEQVADVLALATKHQKENALAKEA